MIKCPFPRRFFKAAVAISLTAFSLFANGPDARAEFLRTGSRAYQHTSQLTLKVISTNGPKAGIFVVNTSDPIDVQLFDPSQLPKEKSEHCFIEYDSSLQRYLNLYVGSHQYRIQGSLKLEFSGLTIAIDNITPYLSIAFEKDLSVLGFRGVDEVINSSGDAAFTLFPANVFNRYSEVVVPYTLSPEGLQLRGKPVSTTYIGLYSDPPKNPCLAGENVVFVASTDLAELKKTSSEAERVTKLDNLLTKSKLRNPLEEGIVLQQDKDIAIALNVADGQVNKITQLKARTSKNKIVCVVEELSL